jgi:hypothetical protein
MHNRVRLAVGAAALVLLAVTGCSSSGSSPTATTSPTSTALSGTAYTLALNAISASEDQAHQAVEQALHAKTVAKVQSLLSAFADDQETTAQRLLQLQPPADAASAHAELVKALTDNAAAIRVLVGQLSSAKTAKQAVAMIERDQGASSAGDRIDAALKQLRKLGYA